MPNDVIRIVIIFFSKKYFLMTRLKRSATPKKVPRPKKCHAQTSATPKQVPRPKKCHAQKSTTPKKVPRPKKCHAQKSDMPKKVPRPKKRPTLPPTPKIQNGSIELKICRDTKFKSDERPVLVVD